jgi:Tfp pilus assembly protein PilO
MPAVQVSLTLVLSLFVMAIFIVFALRPTIISIVTLKKTIIESKATFEQLNTKIANLQSASDQLDLIKNFLPTLNTNIPNDGAKYFPITITVEALANQNEIKLESESLGATLLFSRIITPFTPSKNQSVIALPFNARVIGNYSNVLAFLTKLLSMERIIMIESVTITKETGTKLSGANVALNVTGSAYFLANEAQLQKSIIEIKGVK